MPVFDGMAPTTQTPANDPTDPIPITRARKVKGREDLQVVRLDLLRRHPRNPRLVLNADVIAGIAAQLQASGRFHPSHAIVARPLEGLYEIVEGHHRAEAARAAGLAEVPCWVRAMDDHEALLAVGLANTQRELAPIEIGRHSLDVAESAQGRKGLGIAEYARRMGLDRSTLVKYRAGATVYQFVSTSTSWSDPRSARSRALHFAEISKLNQDLWAEMVAACIAEDWSLRDTAERVRVLLRPMPTLDVPTISEVHPDQIEEGLREDAVHPTQNAEVPANTLAPASPIESPRVIEAAIHETNPACGEENNVMSATSAGSSGGDSTSAPQHDIGHIHAAREPALHVVQYGDEVLAVEDTDGAGYHLHVQLPATQVLLRLRPAPDGGVLVRVEAPASEPEENVEEAVAPAVEDVGPEPEAATEAPVVDPGDEPEVDQDAGDEADASGVDERLAGLRRRLRELVKAGRTTVSKSAAKLGLAPKVVMGGKLTKEQVDALAQEVARVVKRGRAI